MAEISEIKEDEFFESTQPCQTANLHEMHCTNGDLATLHTFEAQFHDALRFLDTLDEDPASPGLLAVDVQCAQGSPLEKCFCECFASPLCASFSTLNNSAIESRKRLTSMFLPQVALMTSALDVHFSWTRNRMYRNSVPLNYYSGPGQEIPVTSTILTVRITQ